MDIVYRVGGDGYEGALFAEHGKAEYVVRIRKAIEQSTTWGEFRCALPEGEWDSTFVEHFADYEEGPPADEEAFEADDVPGYSECGYPEWLMQTQLDWFPPELIAKYGGNVANSVNDGAMLELPAGKAEQIADALRALGHTVERTDLDIS